MTEGKVQFQILSALHTFMPIDRRNSTNDQRTAPELSPVSPNLIGKVDPSDKDPFRDKIARPFVC